MERFGACHCRATLLWRGLCFLPQVPSFLWLWALSLPPCCCSWSAVVSDLFVTSSRKPAPWQQRSLITSSMACTCSQSGRGVIWETGTLMWSPGAWYKTFLHLCVSLCFLLSAVSNLSSFQVGKIMTVHDDSHTEPCQLVTLLLIVTAFKASNIIMFMTSFKCCPSEKLIVNVYQRIKGLTLIYAVSILG